jgi:hypothetical protein
MLIECSNCEAKVDAKVLAEKNIPANEDSDPYKYLFMECPSCHSIMLGGSELEPVEDGNWSFRSAKRLYPEPPIYFDHSIPKTARQSLYEAKKCLSVGAYSAAAVMCGRAIEAISISKTTAKSLADGLKKLKDQNIIDQRLYDWGEALRKERNMGAHANESDISKDDARDVFDFAKAFCDYIYVLSEKYEEYLDRKKNTI